MRGKKSRRDTLYIVGVLLIYFVPTFIFLYVKEARIPTVIGAEEWPYALWPWQLVNMTTTSGYDVYGYGVCTFMLFSYTLVGVVFPTCLAFICCLFNRGGYCCVLHAKHMKHIKEKEPPSSYKL